MVILLSVLIPICQDLFWRREGFRPIRKADLIHSRLVVGTVGWGWRCSDLEEDFLKMLRNVTGKATLGNCPDTKCK